MFAIEYDHPKRYINAYEYKYIEIYTDTLLKKPKIRVMMHRYAVWFSRANV